ncbi:MAG: redox-sensing transcriptional repressor Rex [Eubacteriales bacterium]
MNKINSIPELTLKRLPLYLSYLKTLPKDAPSNISATAIAADLEINDVQVRKDLAALGDGGRPKIGYIVEELINEIENCLGYRDAHSAALVGVSDLGRALLCYDGFCDFGMNIVVAFDKNKELVGTQINGKHILALEKLENLCERMKTRIGIITAPAEEAQEICDILVYAGAIAIWNFTTSKLNVPADVMVLNEHIEESIPILTRYVEDTI